MEQPILIRSAARRTSRPFVMGWLFWWLAAAVAGVLLLVPSIASAASSTRTGPAVGVDPAANSQFVFWPGQSADIWESYYYHAWRGPVDTSAVYGLGHTSPTPGVAVADDGQQYLFWRSSDGTLREGHYASGWRRYSFPAWGRAVSAPAVAVDPRNHDQYVFWLGADGYIHETWYYGRWHGPVTMTRWGKAASAPTVAVASDNQQYVFWRSSDGSLHEAHHATHWGLHVFPNWRPESAPAAAVDPRNHDQYVFWRGADGYIHETWYYSHWNGPVTMTRWGKAASAPTVAVGNHNQQYVFWQNPSGYVGEAHHTTHWSLFSFPRWRPEAITPTARQLAGERVIYSYRGLTPPAALISQIKAGEAAGVIFFGQNISSEAQIKHVIAELQRDSLRSPVHAPLLMMIDQEGGAVRRLPGAPTASEKQIGQAANPPAAATQAGHSAGLNVKGVGVNVNLAPVLGVYRTAGDFLDHYGRSYSPNAGTVARLGANFIHAQQQIGVAATAKHFPGLGAASAQQNTDSGPVTLNVPLASLRSIDELPYKSAVAAGADLVMLSWAVYPALDSGRPAGLSSTVIQHELRGRLGFNGVTVTDALEAGALARYGSTSNRAVLAARAGMDLILCSSQDVTQGTAAVNALAAALNNRTLSRTSFNTSVNRVLALRNRLGN